MGIEAFVARADAVRARNKILESVPGSGFHDNDRDAHNRLAAPHMRHLPGGMAEGSEPLPRISDNVVAFLDKRVARFYGADANRVQGAMVSFLEDIKKKPFTLLTGSERKLFEEIPLTFVADGVLELWLDTWNDYLLVLDAKRIGVSCLPYSE